MCASLRWRQTLWALACFLKYKCGILTPTVEPHLQHLSQRGKNLRRAAGRQLLIESISLKYKQPNIFIIH